MKGMEGAVARIVAGARRRGAHRLLRRLRRGRGHLHGAAWPASCAAAGGDVITYVPHRLVEGYGLNVEAVERLAAQGA